MNTFEELFKQQLEENAGKTDKDTKYFLFLTRIKGDRSTDPILELKPTVLILDLISFTKDEYPQIIEGYSYVRMAGTFPVFQNF